MDDDMVKLKETQDGWRVTINGLQFDATEEQLIRLRKTLTRTFSKTETIRRLCQKRWANKRFRLKRTPFDYMILMPGVKGKTIPIQAEAFLRSLAKREQTVAREYISRLGYKKDSDNAEE